tara:strand:- start:301 stop:513 length:213 start_codon:yes stop_codon:yes gene_type:complete
MSFKVKMRDIPENSIIQIQHHYDDRMEEYLVIGKERGFLVMISREDNSKRYTRLSSIKKMKIKDKIFTNF